MGTEDKIIFLSHGPDMHLAVSFVLNFYRKTEFDTGPLNKGKAINIFLIVPEYIGLLRDQVV
jgi:hypothetical protein